MLDRELTDFIGACIRSVWAVEMLLVLRRRADAPWEIPELVGELRASEPLVREVLAAFSASGLVREPEPGRFVYEPASPALDALCSRLEAEYRRRPVMVVNTIVSGARDRVQGLADAFRFKGDK